jgi:hypothetical protein
MTAGNQVRLSFLFQSYRRLARDIQQVIHHRFDQRYSFLATERFRFPFWVAGDERALGSGSRLGVAEDVNPVIDLFLEFIFVDEPSRERGKRARESQKLVMTSVAARIQPELQ